VTTEREHLSTAELAKVIRDDLKREFPGQKFSVTSSHFSGGSAIDVQWTDGPAYAEVHDLVSDYANRGFDGMIDMAYTISHARLPDGRIVRVASEGTEGSGGSHPSWREQYPGAKPVTCSASYVQCQRHHSETALRWALAQMVKQQFVMEEDFEIVPGSSGKGWTVSPWVRWHLTPETAGNLGYTRIAEDELNTFLGMSFYQRPTPDETHTEAPAEIAGATITQERDWVWITFAAKPAEDVIERLRSLGARWSRRRSAWYLTDADKAGELVTLAV
jgi:hypothetical protein